MYPQKIAGMSHGAGFVLFIDYGNMNMLEGFSYDEPWPSSIAKFTLEYSTEGERDWVALEKKFSETNNE